MNSIFETVNSVGVPFVDFAVPMLVQSSVLILILLLADALLRKKVRAVFRYGIWMVVLLKLVLPTSLSSPVSLGQWFGDELAYVEMTQRIAGQEREVDSPSPAAAQLSTKPVPVESDIHTPAVSSGLPDTPARVVAPTIESTVSEPMAPPPVPITPISWQGILFLLWLAVVLAMGMLLIQRAAFVRGLVAQAQEADGSMTRMLLHCRKQMGIGRKVGLKVSVNATSPAVCGLFKPVILVPQNLAPSLSPEQRHVVLLHELAHIKRGDLWVNLAQTILQIVYFYNPLLWLANAIIRRAREQAVDETVLVAMGEHAEQYPQTLVDVAKLAFRRPVLSLRLIGVVESKGALSGRIKRILSRPIPKSAKLGVLGLLTIVIAAAILLPMAKSEWSGRGNDEWADKDLLIKFTPSRPGPVETIGPEGKATWSVSHDVEFREGEELLVVVELYRAGKPMRVLGRKIFRSSTDPDRLSAHLTRAYGNEAKTILVHSAQVQLGDQILEVPEFTVEADRFHYGEGWGRYGGHDLRKKRHQRTGQEYARLENLFYWFNGSGGDSKEGQVYFWIPGRRRPQTPSHHHIRFKMVPVSQLKHLTGYADAGWQGLDGKTIPANLPDEQAEAMAEQYFMKLAMPLPELTAHKYYKVGDPIQIYVNVKGSNGWKPTLEEIYHDDDVNPVIFLIDGKEYGCRLGFGPFGGGGMTLHLPGELYIDSTDFHLPPGGHTVACGWKNVHAINPDDPNRVVHYERLTTDAAEFEVVEEMPAGYYSEIYEEGWEDILRRSIETPFTDDYRNGGVAGALFGLKVKPLPFDIAFEIYAQAEGSKERVYAAKVAKTKTDRSEHRLGCDHQVKEINWDTVGQTRWRLILVPSKKVAMQYPPIRHYYGRELVTDWAMFDRSPRFQQNRLSFERRKNAPPHYGGTIKADKPVDLDRLSRRWRGDANEVWPLPDGFELGWSDKNGGTLRIDPHSDVRMLWFPQTNANLVRATAETRRRLAELRDSKLTEIHPPKGERTLIAVRSSEGRAYFVRVRKVNETWANLSWWPARGVDDGPFGRLVDKRGKGVGNATLVFHKRVPTEEKFQEITVMSEGSGAFILPKIERGKSMSVRISAPGYEELESAHVEHHTDGTYFPENLIFTLHRLGTISGSVIGPDGKPLAGAPLSLSTYVRYPDFGKNISTSNQLRSISDSRGRFVMRDVPPGTHLLFYPWKGPSSKEVEDGTWRAFQKPGERRPSAPVKGVLGAAVIEVGQGQKVRDIVIDLSQSTCTAEGCVSDSAGRPVAGARVSLYWKISGHASSIASREYGPAVTDSHGWYRLENLPPGDWHVRAWHDRPSIHSDEVPIRLVQDRTIRRDLTLPRRLEVDKLKVNEQPETKPVTKEITASDPAPLESLSPPIIAYDVKLNFADPTVRDGSFHSKQSVAFVLGFHDIDIPQVGKIITSHLQIGQTTWSVRLKGDRLTIQDGATGREIRSEEWPVELIQFRKVITLAVKYGQHDYSCPVHVDLVRQTEGVPLGDYWFCAYLSGRLPWGAGGRSFEIVNLDQQMEFRLVGDGTDTRDAVLGIDINGDGRIDPAETGGEQFDLYEPFQIGPKTYRVTEVDPYMPRVVFRELESGKAAISSPIKNVLSSKTGTGGTFEWGTSLNPHVRFRHGWYSIEDNAVREHCGGSSSRNPYEGPVKLKLIVEVKEDMLNIEMQRIEGQDDGIPSAKVSCKTPAPAGAYLRHGASTDPAVLSDRHLTLWQGDFVRDGRIVKSVVYAAYMTTPDGREAGFMPPELLKAGLK